MSDLEKREIENKQFCILATKKRPKSPTKNGLSAV